MNKLEVIDMLNDAGIRYNFIEHPPVETIKEIKRFDLPNPETIVKNLFLRDDKKKSYYLVVVRSDRTVNLKELSKLLGSRPLSFASENDLMYYLGLKKGSVTPFEIFNDVQCRVNLVINESILSFKMIGIHPNENTATLWISPFDLQTIIEKHGNSIISLKI